MTEHYCPPRAITDKTIIKRRFYICSLIVFLIIFSISCVTSWGAQDLIDNIVSPEELLIYTVIGFMPALVLFVYAYYFLTGRLRDCGKNTYHAWFILIPLFGLGYCIYLCFPVSKEITTQQQLVRIHPKNSRAETSDLILRRSSANSGYIS